MPGYIHDLSDQMRLFRLGLVALPADYVELHRLAANKDLPRFAAKNGLRVLATEMVSSGDMDGMHVMRVVAEDQTGKLHDVRYSDANGGSWFRRHESGGYSLIEMADGAPGHL